MKMTKSELKNIVKECLVEILNEGLAGSLVTSMRQPMTSTLLQHATRSPAVETKRAVQSSPALKETIKREAGGNRVMESILADTAASTLPKMLEGDRKGHVQPAPGGVIEQVVAAASPEDLFGDEIASKWADLAFSGPLKK